jgi:hypothetical protein
MKRYARVLLLILIAFPWQPVAVANGEEPRMAEQPYNHQITYQGIFKNARLYKRASSACFWQGSRNPAFLNEVTCSSAKAALDFYGRWNGNLKKNGSCGDPAEPNEWVTGNFLNYQMPNEKEE